jgi:hypothetical protein
MLVITAKNKTTGLTSEFTPTEWYSAQQTHEYDYTGTKFVSEQNMTPVCVGANCNKTTVKRGCGCGKKNK